MRCCKRLDGDCILGILQSGCEVFGRSGWCMSLPLVPSRAHGLLSELLPSENAGKGWPWTTESKLIPPVMSNDKPWPKISIVTPSYNQGQFIEETIRSVLLQNYPNLEYIIMDGGSTDNSVKIIKKYEPWLTYWVSEKDNGQADAIQKGFQKATGEVIGWLNSDDFFLPDALVKVGEKIHEDPGMEFIVGGGMLVDNEGRLFDKYYSFPQSFESLLSIGQFSLQMSSFWRRDVYSEIGGLDTGLRFCFDYDFFLRLTRRRQPGGIDSLLSASRMHPGSKTSTIFVTVALPEADLVRKRYGFDEWSESEKENKRRYFSRQYHLNKRRAIIRDLIYDPVYFFKQLKRKISSF